MEPPWILVLCHEFPPLGGGAGKNLFLLCRELTRRGVKVRVWTTDPGASKRWRHDFEVDYIDAGRKARFETSLRGMAAFVAGSIARTRACRKERPALVFSNLGIPAGVAGTLVAGLLGVPHAVWYQGSDIHAGRLSGPGRFQRWLLRRVWRRSRMSFFVSPGLLEMAALYGKPPRPHILPTCPSLEIVGAEAGEAPAAADACFLFLGRFDPVKNPLLLLQAVDRLKTRAAADPRVQVTRKFRLVGSGGLGPDVQKFIRIKALSSQVVLEGAAAFDKVPDLMRSAYALVLPSRIEGFNTTALEAAHFGVPTVASDVPGIRDFVRHMETGLLFKENDADGLAEALRVLSADPALRDALGRKAKAAAAGYRPGRVADAFLAGVAEVVPGLGAYAHGESAWN